MTWKEAAAAAQAYQRCAWALTELGLSAHYLQHLADYYRQLSERLWREAA